MLKLDFTKDEVKMFKDKCYFTPQELIILEERLQGADNQLIADKLHISVSTVGRRVKSIRKKIMKIL